MAMEAKQLAEQQAKEKQEAKIAERKALMEAKIKAAQGESSYLADEKERDLYHIKLDKPAYSPKDGKKLSKAFIQKFSVSDWKNHLKHGAGLGFTHDVLWNPEAYAQA
jgi:hypothetical protein